MGEEMMQVKSDLVMVCELGAVLISVIVAWLVGLTFGSIVDVGIVVAFVVIVINIVMCIAATMGKEWAVYPEKKLVITVGIE
ncbi:MAG: hypothetical protein WC489_08605 [Patescibacteria group bacterium]|jgi:uncharacterized membrane protein (DUF485 family)|nr:hypothetical protein [Dehalococcoidia bacterium]